MTMAVGNLVFNVWRFAAIGLWVLLSVLAAGHAVLHKRDSRAAIAWVGCPRSSIDYCSMQEPGLEIL